MRRQPGPLRVPDWRRWYENCNGRGPMLSKNDFSPTFCPNPSCDYASHKKNENGKIPFKRKGLEYLQDGSWHQRFVCKGCKKNFSDSTFHINYRLQKRGHINARIFDGVVHNRSNRSLARELGVSENLVRIRILRLSRHALLRHDDFIDGFQIREPVAYDGLQAFAGSQYEPNNVNQAVGSESLFCYLFNYAPMNRGGRISDRQRKYLFKLEEREGRFDSKAIRHASADIFRELAKRKAEDLSALVVRSDEHFHYRRAMKMDLSLEDQAKIIHQTVSSKATRNYKNILFPVNHLDLMIRRKVAAFTRETICFSKKPSRMMHKYILYICYKNYMKPQFVKEHKNNAKAHTHSPAMHLGICAKLLKFHEFFIGFEPKPSTGHMPLDWSTLYEDRVAFVRSSKFKKRGTGDAKQTRFPAHN